MEDYDPGEMDMPEYSRTTEETPMETQDTSLTYDTNTQYNTDDTNLETNDDFDYTGIQPRNTEESRLMREHNLRTQTQVETLITTEYQRFAKEKGWKYTKTGLKLLAERSTRRGGRLYYYPDSKEFDVRYEMSEVQQKNNSNSRSFCLSEVFNPDKFLTEDRMKSKWGVKFVNHLKRLINTPDPPGMRDHTPMDNDPYTRQIQQQQISPETQKLIDDLLRGEKPIKRLQDATEEELKGLGFHELALREWRSMRTASIDLAEAKRVRDMKALPGIIGSIVSFILKSIGAAVGFLAEHMIILVIIIVSSIVYGLVEGVRYIKQKSTK